MTPFGFNLLKSNNHKINQFYHFIVCSVYLRELFDILDIVKMMFIFDPVMKYHVDIKNKQT